MNDKIIPTEQDAIEEIETVDLAPEAGDIDASSVSDATDVGGAVTASAPVAAQDNSGRGPRGRGDRNDRSDRGGRNARGGRGGPRREGRIKPEFDQKIIDIRRVTRVAAGGRRFTFAVSLVAGDRKGRIGVGTGKGGDTALAVEKAFRNAKKNVITLNLTKTNSIAHSAKAKYSSARVEIMPAEGKGVAAGSSVRDVIELAGVRDIVAKLRSGTKNPLNNARAAVKALSLIKKPMSRNLK